MKNLHNVNELLQREVSRKEFLRLLGLLLLTVIGVKGMLSNISGSLNPAAAKRLRGYGTTPYGR